MKKQISLQSRLSGIKSLYLVGDEGCDKSFIFDFLELEQEELNHEINIYVKVFENMSSVELYDFPGDKLLRSAMELYLKLLPQPISIVYFIRSDGIEKDLVDWIQIFRKCDVSSKIVFVSDVTTYMEREKILNRIAKEFEINILDVILFVTLEPYSFRRAFDHVQDIGAKIEDANCLKPTLGRKIINSIVKMIKNIKKNRRSAFSHIESDGVI